MCRIGIALFAAGLLILAGSTAAWAQNDTFRLGSSSSGAAAAVSGGTDTELVHWRGGYRHGYGYWGGRAYYRPYWGGYGYAAYYRPAYYRPAYYRPNYYRSVVYLNYYQPYYYAAPAYYPISGQADVPATLAQLPAQTQPVTSQYQPSTARPQLLPPPATVPQQPSGNQTFPYDGGPQVPLPMPQVDPASGPRPTVPLQGKIVSLPVETTGGTTPLFTVSLGTYGQPIAAPRSYTYQAYGEQSLPYVRKQTK
jgi:hypothetical protein